MPHLNLEPGLWYGMTMSPGYVDRPYHSPIKIHALRTLDANAIDLDFYSANYAQGVRNMAYRLCLLTAVPNRLAFIRDDPRRVVEIAPLTLGWARSRIPDLHGRLLQLAQHGLPITEAMDKIAAE